MMSAEETCYFCPALVEDQRCDAQFDMHRSLATHMVRKHGCRTLAHLLTACNQCPARCAVHKTKDIAKVHLASSFKRGFCRAVWERGSVVTAKAEYERRYVHCVVMVHIRQNNSMLGIPDSISRGLLSLNCCFTSNGFLLGESHGRGT